MRDMTLTRHAFSVWKNKAAAGILMACALGFPFATQANVLFQDDFNQNSVNMDDWFFGTWQLGHTQLTGAPAVTDGVAHLSLQTYNAVSPGASFVGTEIYTKQAFERGNGLEMSARVHFNDVPDGAVASFFTYGYDTANASTDEIDFEFLTKKTNHAGTGGPAIDLTNWNDWSESNGYDNNPHHWTSSPTVAGLDFQTFNTFTTRWLPTKTEWLVNGNLVASSTEAVPDAAMPVHFNFWAPNDSWSDAYSAAFQPTSDPQLNQTFFYDIDSVTVRSIPEPSSQMLLGLGLMLLVSGHSLRSRRREQRTCKVDKRFYFGRAMMLLLKQD